MFAAAVGLMAAVVSGPFRCAETDPRASLEVPTYFLRRWVGLIQSRNQKCGR